MLTDGHTHVTDNRIQQVDYAVTTLAAWLRANRDCAARIAGPSMASGCIHEAVTHVRHRDAYEQPIHNARPFTQLAGWQPPHISTFLIAHGAAAST